MGDSALSGARDAKLFCYPGIFVELQSVAVEVVIIIWVVNGKLIRIDTDDRPWKVRFSPMETLPQVSLDEYGYIPYFACISAISHRYFPRLK